jgi:hypothetical protein
MIAAVSSLLAGEADGLDQIGEMSPRAHAVVLLATVVCALFILRLVRRHGLRSKYTLLWLTLAAVLTAIGVFPGLLVAVSRVLGINYPPAAFLALAVGLLFLIVIQFSWEISRLEERSRTLAERSALLGEQLDELRNELENRRSADQSDPLI